MLLIIAVASLITTAASNTLYFHPKDSNDVLCPDKQGTCPTGSTCCLLSSGKYGCCPLKQVMTQSFFWSESLAQHMFLLHLDYSSDIGSSVLHLMYILFQAVCCQDHIHCCPNGYTCNTAAGTCNPKSENGISIPWKEKFPASPLTEGVTCPGGQMTCPAGSTCCKLSTGMYGCCPIPQVFLTVKTVIGMHVFALHTIVKLLLDKY